MIDPMFEQLLTGFVDESDEIRQRISDHLFKLEKAEVLGGPDFDDLARGLHTLKGSAATLGLDDLADLAHRSEDVILPLSGQPGPLPAPLADGLLHVLDVWMARIRALASKNPQLPDLAPALALLDRLLQGPEGQEPQREPAPKAQPAPEPEPQEKPPPEAKAADAGRSEEATWRVGTRRVLALMREVERLRELRLRLDERRRDLDRGVALLTRMALTADTAEARNALSAASRAMAAGAEETADIVTSMEDGLKAISTLPVDTAVEPLRRTLRDLCRRAGKEARLVVTGAELSLDRRVLEALQGALSHLVRNAVDHGLESPPARVAHGKPAEGTLRIDLRQDANTVIVEVADDGKGLDTERIREVALRRGVAPAEELSSMDTEQIHQLIFRPGFSTRDEADELSGRGVGLDAVRAQAQALQGTVTVHSTLGKGARFVISVPAESGSVPLVLARCGEHRLAIPVAALESSLICRVRDLDVKRTRIQLRYRDQLIPVQDLGALLGFRQPEAPAEGSPLLVVRAQQNLLALSVDEIFAEQELVVRPLPPDLRAIAAYQGAATLARGELVLIVRPEWMVQVERKTDKPQLVGTRRALVVDDSLTARALHRTALESGGYVVHTASDARQALEQLRHAAYDVMVCDIGMPEMDGFALTSALRARSDFDGMPIVLVSARESEAEVARGLTAGADAFLSKRECVSGRLISEVTAAISRRKARA